jgi:FkbM family methyltransferase
MEIGANFAQDANYLAEKFGINPENVWVFEAHPEMYDAIKKIHPKFKAFNYAVFDKEQEMIFNMYSLGSVQNMGLSSLLEIVDVSLPLNCGETTVQAHPYAIKSVRMDNFMDEYRIKEVDFLKLDVEGVNYEVLLGFGDRLKDVKCIHTESEQYDNLAYKRQKENWTKIKKLLEKANFEMTYFQKSYSQADSFWVRKDVIKKLY